MTKHVDPAKALVEALWADGLTLSQIAVALTALAGTPVTRSKVAGMVHRMGLPKQGRPPAAPKEPRPKMWKPKTKVVNLPRQKKVKEEFIIPVEQRCTIHQLTDKTCRWPVDDPRKPDFFYCGGTIDKNFGDKCPYCRYHAGVAGWVIRAREAA
jgi:GcrA cell cycle regulator